MAANPALRGGCGGGKAVGEARAGGGKRERREGGEGSGGDRTRERHEVNKKKHQLSHLVQAPPVNGSVLGQVLARCKPERVLGAR
eukprot:6913612-Pyramimonas_sp.AAC.1